MWCSHDFCESILITLDFLSCSWPSIILSVASASASSKGCHIYKSTLRGNMINYIVKLHTKNVDFTFPSFLLFLFWIAKAILPFPLIFLFFWIRFFFFAWCIQVQPKKCSWRLCSSQFNGYDHVIHALKRLN